MNNQDIKDEITAKSKNELPVLRARLGITQDAIADIVGISRQTYSSIESGRRQMSWITCMSLIAFFQSNIQTSNMLDAVDGFNKLWEKIISLER